MTTPDHTEQFRRAADQLAAALDTIADLVENEETMTSTPISELDQFTANLREAQNRVDAFLGYMPGPRIDLA
jgi:hypothetical protein